MEPEFCPAHSCWTCPVVAFRAALESQQNRAALALATRACWILTETLLPQPRQDQHGRLFLQGHRAPRADTDTPSLCWSAAWPPAERSRRSWLSTGGVPALVNHCRPGVPQLLSTLHCPGATLSLLAQGNSLGAVITLPKTSSPSPLK